MSRAERERVRQKRLRDAATDKGIDARRIAKLSTKELDHLWRQMGDLTRNTRGYDKKEYHCYECHRPVRKRGEPEPVKLNLEVLELSGIHPYRQWRCSHVALARAGKIAPKRNSHASHLCDNPRCVRADHLVWESNAKNNERKGCLGIIACPCCDTYVEACVHEPRCIKIQN